MVYLLPFFSYLAGSTSVSARPPVRPYDPDTMTNIALEAIASSSGNYTSALVQLWILINLSLAAMLESRYEVHKYKVITNRSGDQTIRRPHMLCSICVHSFGTLAKAVRLFITSEPKNVLSPTVWLQFYQDTFRTPVFWRFNGMWCVGGRPISMSIARPYVPVRFLLAQVNRTHDHKGLKPYNSYRIWVTWLFPLD